MTQLLNNTAMAEACYTALATMKQQVLDRINKLTLQTNKHGQSTHDAILLLQKGIQRVHVSQFDPSDPGKGMVKLLDDGNNILTQVKSTNVITAGSVIKAAKKRAVKLLTTTIKTILPTFTA
jgi:ferritin-like metal-binding protein YciE